MSRRIKRPVLTGVNNLNKSPVKHCPNKSQDAGGSLIELMAVVLIITIIATMTIPLLHQQVAAREIDIIARRFITHAQFARAQALTLGIPVHISPLNGHD